MSDHPNLAAALAAVQSELPTVHKGNRATVPTKAGGSYSYTYADLGDVSAAALPLLSSHGLAFTCLPRVAEGRNGYELTGVLLHTSGERIEGALPLSGNTPQEWGSSITYMRRYLLGSLTGLVTDDDDDGNTIQRAARAPRKPPAPQPASEPAPTPSGPPAANDGQRKKMHALLGELGITDRDKRIALAAWSCGRPVTSTSDLTAAEAAHFIDYLAQRAKHDKEQS